MPFKTLNRDICSSFGVSNDTLLAPKRFSQERIDVPLKANPNNTTWRYGEETGRKRTNKPG